jgi:hypothetical protein
MAYTAALFQGRKIINQDSHSNNTLNQLNYTAFYLGLVFLRKFNMWMFLLLMGLPTLKKPL